MGRSSVGVRHEGTALLAYEMFPSMDRVFEFTHDGLGKEPNILRDSVYLRGQTIPQRVDIHVRATMFHVVWDEFRARGNLQDKDGRALDPLRVAELNDQLWAVGVMLRSEDDDEVLRIFDPAYEPFAPDPRMDKWREIRASRTVKTVDGTGVVNFRAMAWEKISTYGRDDWAKYKPVLVKFLRLFGEGIRESLTRTCWDQLSHLTGTYSAAGAQEWMKARAADLLPENDNAESPFAKVTLSTSLPLIQH